MTQNYIFSHYLPSKITFFLNFERYKITFFLNFHPIKFTFFLFYGATQKNNTNSRRLDFTYVESKRGDCVAIINNFHAADLISEKSFDVFKILQE